MYYIDFLSCSYYLGRWTSVHREKASIAIDVTLRSRSVTFYLTCYDSDPDSPKLGGIKARSEYTDQDDPASRD